MALLVGQHPSGKSIPLTTRKGTSIRNHQQDTKVTNALSVDSRFRAKYPKIVAERTDLSSYYNCHGLVFASRRTWVGDPKQIKVILEEDCYVEVKVQNVLPGDVILYYDNEGDPEHSGFVVSQSDKRTLMIPLVVSKWGHWREVVHWANDCPYEYQRAKFFRVEL